MRRKDLARDNGTNAGQGTLLCGEKNYLFSDYFIFKLFYFRTFLFPTHLFPRCFADVDLRGEGRLKSTGGISRQTEYLVAPPSLHRLIRVCPQVASAFLFLGLGLGM